MLEELSFKCSGLSIHRVAGAINIGSQILKSFEQEYTDDQASKNAAIDIIIQILNMSKV